MDHLAKVKELSNIIVNKVIINSYLFKKYKIAKI